MNSMSIRSTCRYAVSLILALAPASLFAQWVDYPTPGVPRTADGKPDLAAPRRRRKTGLLGNVGLGKPVQLRCKVQRYADLARVYQYRRFVEGSRALPAVGGRVGQETKRRAGPRSQRALHAARSSANLDRRLIQANFPRPGPRAHPYGAQHTVPADFY